MAEEQNTNNTTATANAFAFGQRLLSEREREAGRAFAETFGKVTDEKRNLILRQMHWLFTDAYLAYVCRHDENLSPDERLLRAGAWAYQFRKLFEDIMTNLGTDIGQTIAKLQHTSDWFKRHGWTGLPEYDDIDGTHVVVTAEGMVRDMRRICEVCDEFLKTLETGKQAADTNGKGRKEVA